MAKPQRKKPDAPEAVEQAQHPVLPAARQVQPVGPRVLVRIIKSPDRLDSGLFLPQGVKDGSAAALLGEVVEVARTLPRSSRPPGAEGSESEPMPSRHRDAEDEDDVDLGQNVSGIPLGSSILFEKDRGVAIPWDESLRLLEVRHVLALVDIITEDKIQ